MSDKLGRKKFCSDCDYCSDTMVCMNEDADFYKLCASSVLLAPCHSKFENNRTVEEG